MRVAVVGRRGAEVAAEHRELGRAHALPLRLLESVRGVGAGMFKGVRATGLTRCDAQLRRPSSVVFGPLVRWVGGWYPMGSSDPHP